MQIRLLVFAVCWPLVPLGAQDAVPLTADTRLRVTAEHGIARVETGTYHALTDTTLVLSCGASMITLPLASITRVEVSRGQKPNVAGGVVGFLLGAAAGGALACTANRDDYGVFCAGQDDSKLVLGAALGGVAGAALGALLFRKERWRVIDVSGLRSTPR
jgi:hypothetical protein